MLLDKAVTILHKYFMAAAMASRQSSPITRHSQRAAFQSHVSLHGAAVAEAVQLDFSHPTKAQAGSC